MENKDEGEDNNSNNILNQDFFDTIKLSKKINSKIKKINELTEYLQKNPNYINSPDIKTKIADLLILLLTNLNENNNNYVLAQMGLIVVLGQTINKEESFKNFVKQSLPKLFDKFYLGNDKINDNLIEIFNQFISFKILSIKHFFQYIENIPLEEEDNYRINIINFLYDQINKDETVLLNNIPKSINDLIKKLVNDNESDISEIASKILNILINRDIESNKKKEQEKIEENLNKDLKEKADNKDKNEKNNDEGNKGKSSTSKFVTKIVNAIKKEVDMDIDKKENNEEKIVNENKTKIENNMNKTENNIQEQKKEQNKNIHDSQQGKNETKKEEEKNEKKEEKKEKVEEIKKEQTLNTEPDKSIAQNINLEQNKNEENNKIGNMVESKPDKEEKKLENNKNITLQGASDSNIIKDKKEENKTNYSAKENEEIKKDGKENKLKKGGGVKRAGIKSQINKFRKNLEKNKKKGDAFEFELVEKKKDGNIEKSEIIPEEKEKESVNNIEIKEQTKEEIKKENNQEKEKGKAIIEEKKEIKEKIKNEIIKEDIIKKELENKKEIKAEEKPKNILKEETKIEEKKEEIKEEIKLEEKKEEINNIDYLDNIENKRPAHKNSIKIMAANKQSLNEFEKKLQLALELEEKEGLLNKNNNENLIENNPPIKQKKEDSKFDEIKTVLGKEIVDSLFSPKWEAKKHGFELINEFINNKPKNSYNINDLIEYMKLKLKNYKETNFNINREAINIYINMIKKKILSKDLLTPIIIAYHEKLADIKLKDNLVELINNSFDIIEPSSILKQIISKISKKNNAKLLIEYSTFLGSVVEEYDVKDLPNKDIIDLCKVMANNSNPQVRTAAISLLCILYKYLGKDVKTLTRDIKESTLKLIDAELDKVQVIDPKESAGKKKKVASTTGREGKSSSGGGGELIPPQDISKKITDKILKDLNGKWAEKKEACENIEKILNSANMRILPNGLNNFMTNIKKKLSDSNKNFVKMIISLLSKFIESLKQGFRQWAKPIALALIPNLADKNQLMRNECQNCFDKWVEFAGFDSLVVHFPPFLKTDNTEMRIEIMNFFIKYKDKFNKSTGELVYKEMINPLLICLQDRSSNVRNAAEDIIKSSIQFIPINTYYKKSEDFKPAITKTIKQILDKIKAEIGNAPKEENTNNIGENEAQKNTNTNTKNNSQKLPSKKASNQLNEARESIETGIEDTEKNVYSNNKEDNYNTVSNFSKTMKKPEKDTTTNKLKKNNQESNFKNTKPKRKLSEDDLVNPLGTAINKQIPVSSVNHLASNSTILKKNDKRSFQKYIATNPKTSAVFLMNVKVIPNKIKRLEKDKKTKFNLETVSKDYFNKLKDQCKALFIEDFSKKIFSDDFRKQADAFKEMKSQIDKKINIPIYFDNLDLILKIIGIKIMNNLNPTLIKNFFEFLDSLYLVLFENKYKLNETESNIIINILIDKLSLNNNTLRDILLSLLNKYIEFMDTNKIVVTVINVALNKNNKIKSDILDIIIDLIMEKKLNIANKTYAKLICKFLPLNDNIIRSKTLSIIQEIYSNLGEELWNIIEISDKDREFLEENLIDENDIEEEEEEDINNEGQEDNNNNNSNGNKTSENNNNSKNDIKEKYFTNNQENNNNKFINQNNSITEEDLIESLESLLGEEQNEKVNTIIVIHEILCGKFTQNKDIIISNLDKIITTFITISHQLFFVKDLKTINIKFAKYLSIILCKMASNKELISNLSYDVLLDLSRELLNYLLINGLDKIGDNHEGNIIFKSINSTMLRILENCDITSVTMTLLELIKEFQEKDDKNLISLTIKCLLKTTHNLSEKINDIQIDKILLQIHLLLLSLQKDNPGIAKKTQNNILIINNIKNIVGDFVKLKKEKILVDYSKSVKNHQLTDKFLLNWIKAALAKI